MKKDLTRSGARDEVSLRRFKWLMSQRGHLCEYEENIFKNTPISRRNKVPDFYVQLKSTSAFLVEIKSFEEQTALRTDRSRVGSLNHMQLQKRINRAVRDAADQLKPYADLGLSLVIVLDNHRRIGLPLRDRELICLFGEQSITFKIDPEIGNRISPPELKHQDDGAPFAHGDRPYISAVLVNEPACRLDTLDAEDNFTIERPMRVRVIHHPGAKVPLELSAFQVAGDEHIVYQCGDRWQGI